MEGTNVNVGVSGTATNTASVALVDCVLEIEGAVGGQTFTTEARRDRLAPGETWEWKVAFGEEADELQDNSVEDVAVTTRATYAERRSAEPPSTAVAVQSQPSCRK